MSTDLCVRLSEFMTFVTQAWLFVGNVYFRIPNCDRDSIVSWGWFGNTKCHDWLKI